MNVEQTKDTLAARLRPHGQQHLLAFWDELTAAERQSLAAQIEAIDLAAIAELFRQGVQSEDWAALARRAAPPPAFRLAESTPAISPSQAQQRGQQALAAGQVGVILVAGGQGTRLGFDRPKGMFSVGPVSGASLFQILLEKILARSRAAGMRIPLYLMTSPATHAETVEYLKANENFGLPREDVQIFTQGTMPAVDAEHGRLLLAEKHQLVLSPDGHGGTLYALAPCLADMRRRGLTMLFYCQVDNPLVEMCDPAFLGYHLLTGSELSTQVVAKRTSRDNLGNVVSIDGKLRIIEYSDLNPLDDEIVERKTPQGHPVFWAGNTAVHVFNREFLERMEQSGRALPFHVARKAVSHLDPWSGPVAATSPNAIKFERFIFDLLPEAHKSIVVEIDEAQTFAPVKNASGAKRDSPETVQAQMTALYSEWLRAAGCEVAPGVPVEISPLFAQNAQELAARVSPGMVVTRPQYFC